MRFKDRVTYVFDEKLNQFRASVTINLKIPPKKSYIRNLLMEGFGETQEESLENLIKSIKKVKKDIKNDKIT